MDIALEKRCIKILCASLNSENKFVKMVTLSTIKAARSVLGDNYRYLSHYTVFISMIVFSHIML